MKLFDAKLIELDVIPGSAIKDVISEAFNLSLKYDCVVTFQFNGRKFTIEPKDDLE